MIGKVRPVSSKIEIGNFRAELVAHSVNPAGCEAITFALCYERFIHAEFMTHRWSRNASSSRAIPYARMKAWIDRDPAMPLHLGGNRPGMQSGAEIGNPGGARIEILGMLDEVSDRCDRLHEFHELHKEIVNRYTEPWGWINVVATMGRAQLMNFFKLRIDKHAHPNIQRLAVAMARLYRNHVPDSLEPGDWHLPFTDDLPASVTIHDRIVWSVARCAWTSYQTVEGKDATFEQARKRHDDCVKLKHMTPCEHQLRARDDDDKDGIVPGYETYRMAIPGESADEFDFGVLDREYGDRDFVVA